MKSAEEIMLIFEALHPNCSHGDLGKLAGIDHHTAAHWVAARTQGPLDRSTATRPALTRSTMLLSLSSSE